MDVISLTQKLITFNTVNPPGNEAAIARYIGELLISHGFNVAFTVFEENRLHMVAEKGLSAIKPPIVLSGHLDTVPTGTKQWDTDPFTGYIKGDRLYGRGSSDMKAGVAAMIVAAIQAFKESIPVGGIRLIFTAGEESGCQGCNQLVKSNKELGEASAIIVGEPTANIPAIGHKGALYINVVTSGTTAHSSMPDLGDNAIYKAARAISKIENFKFDSERDSLLGLPTINVGKMSGGMNINSVPDHAEFTIDVRSTTKVNHGKILEQLSKELGDGTSLETLVNLNPVYTIESNPFIQLVYAVCFENGIHSELPKALPYVTDGSVLQLFYNGAPTVILGPGQPEMAHQTNEYCFLSKLQQAVTIYKNIILNWRP
jgi:succinyl-diaminopimelate desuccinylase